MAEIIGMDEKRRPNYLMSIGHTLQIQKCIQVEINEYGKIHNTNRSRKKAGAATVISDKTDFKIKLKYYQKQKGSFNNDERVSPSGHKNYKLMCPK